jgi:hypothetical protein
MAKGDEAARTNPAEKGKIERLLRTVLTLVELLQRKTVTS